MAPRPILTAELLSIGSEIVVGETRDTNAGELARSLTALGVAVRGIRALPDELAAARDGFARAAADADLVVSTGGLGPTPDDLTREAIAAVTGEEPAVDAALEAWLRRLWDRRGVPFPAMNLKQAWLIPSATALRNPNGTAPGWWVEWPDGRLIVALPGPPREMRPMWADEVLPRLRARGAGRAAVSRTLRLAGIGESQLADLLGEELLRGTEPVVATYARSDAVDVRISASGPAAATLVATTTDGILELVGRWVWAEGETSWPAAIGAELDGAGRSLAIVELATAGSLAAILGDVPWVRVATALADDAPATAAARSAAGFEALVRRTCAEAGADVGIGVRARSRGDDTAVSVVVVQPEGVHRERRIAFLGGANGRLRAGLAAADILLRALRAVAAGAVTPGAGARPRPSAATPGGGRPGRGRRSDPGRGGSARRR